MQCTHPQAGQPFVTHSTYTLSSTAGAIHLGVISYSISLEDGMSSICVSKNASFNKYVACLQHNLSRIRSNVTPMTFGGSNYTYTVVETPEVVSILAAPLLI